MAELARIYAENAVVVWAALTAILLTIEVLTGSGWMLWASGAAGVTALAVAGLRLSPGAAVLLFAVLTLATTLLARRFMPRGAVSDDGGVNEVSARLLDRRGRVVAPFSHGAGRVEVEGKEWAAALEGEASLPVGAEIRVTGIEGATLNVRRAT